LRPKEFSSLGLSHKLGFKVFVAHEWWWYIRRCFGLVLALLVRKPLGFIHIVL
jgi:hypothetical protein